MYKNTGPGKAGEYPDTQFFDCIIYNFDIEGIGLKSEHKQFLDRLVAPKLLDGWTFILQGTASQTGSSSFDFRLSQQRVNGVRVYLEQSLKRSLPNLAVEALGKGNPIGKSQEAELDRAVRIFGWHQSVRPPEPKPRPPGPPMPIPEIGPPITPSTGGKTIEFFIKMTAGLSVGPEIVGGEWQRFLIWDQIHSKAAFFDRFAASAGIPTPIPVGFTREGIFNRFVIRKPVPPMTLEEFDGATMIITARGTADVGPTAITIKPFGLGDSRGIVIDPFQTGFNFGFSFQSGSAGTLKLDQDIGVFERKQ